MSVIYQEDFRGWAPGFLPLNPNYKALGEYHCFEYPDLKGWMCPTNHWSWGNWGARFWKVVKNKNKACLTQTIDSLYDNMILIKYDVDARHCAYEAVVTPASRKIVEIGLVFRYRDSFTYYAFILDYHLAKLVKREENRWVVLGATAFEAKKNKSYRLKIADSGPAITCSINGKPLIYVKDQPDLFSGKTGLIANFPASFTGVSLAQGAKAGQSVKSWDIMRNKFKKEYPQPVLWREFSTKGYGTGKNFRFGDLDNDGQMEIVIPQVQYISNSKTTTTAVGCVTAIDLRGNVLWQHGKPSNSSEIIASDVPCQVYDIDGDGWPEVLCAMDFELLIMDGRTGRIKQRMPTPRPIPRTKTEKELLYDYGSPSGEEFPRIVPLGLLVCNVSGKKRASDILLKDYYHNIWIYDNKLRFLWHHLCNIGHTPAFYPLGKDRKDWVVAGFSILDPTGKCVQSFDMAEHCDAVTVGKFNDFSGEPTIAMVAGGGGFSLFDRKGNFKTNMMGHAQHLNIANYRPELPGLEYCVVTFHDNPGVIYMWDTTGKLLWKKEMLIAGCTGEPVNWDGSGEELIFYSGHPEYGGLLNGFGDRVVSFPRDGHPYLCGVNLDLTADKRDEILLWDLDRVSIYTQDRPFQGKSIYEPVRKPGLHNFSNYNAIVSMPRFVKPRA